MALTQVSSDGVKNDAISHNKIPANAIQASELADDAVDTAAIANDAVTNAKVADDAIGIAQLSATGTASNTTFLRGDNSWTTVNTDLVSDTSPQLGGDLDTNSHNISLDDDHKVNFGDSSDLQIYHNGGINYIDATAGNLAIRGTGNDNIIYHNANGNVEIYHDGSKKFETSSAGVKLLGSGTNAIEMTGDVWFNNNEHAGADIYFNSGDKHLIYEDNVKAKFGGAADLQIYHDGSNSYLKDSGTGYLIIESNQLQIKNADADEKMIVADANGAVELYYNNSKKLETYSGGVRLDGELLMQSNHLYINDNAKLRIGSGQDLEIYHDGTHSYLSNGTGNLFVDIPDGQKFQVQHGSEAIINGYADGKVEVYHDNTKRLETTSDGYYYWGTITGGASARSDAGITQTGVLTPTARFFTGGYSNGDQNVTIQATSGNWEAGSSSTSHRSCGLLFNRTTNNVQEKRAGIQHDINGTEKFKLWTSYGDIHFRTRNGNNGNQTWEECDRDPLILHHNGHVAMMHMPYIKWNPGGDSNTYQSDATEHIIDGTAGSTIENGMSLNTSNGRITVPYTGVYQINACIGLYRNYDTARSRLNMMKNGTDVIRQEHANDGGGLSDGGWKTFTLVHAMELSANDYISFDCVGKHDSGAYAVVSVVMLHGTATT